ncbi:MAG: polysaccharide deacetylase family protein [Fimbriimonadaceae bacterium]
MISTRGFVSLTYDGTQLCHVETALPDLIDFKLTGTFYAEPSTLLDHYPAWRNAQAKGHEIGNGSLLAASLPNGSLPAWTTEMILDDLSEANDLIEDLFANQPECSIGLPIGRPICANSGDYSPALRSTYSVIRTGTPGINPAAVRAANHLKIIDPTDLNGSQLAQIARQAIQNPSWIVFAFDGIGSGSRSIDHKSHRQLLEFLSQNQDLLNVMPVINAATALNRENAELKLV